MRGALNPSLLRKQHPGNLISHGLVNFFLLLAPLGGRVRRVNKVICFLGKNVLNRIVSTLMFSSYVFIYVELITHNVFCLATFRELKNGY